jgi:hypothetical protein
MPGLSSVLSVAVPVLALAGCSDNLDPDTNTEESFASENEATLLGEVTPRPLNGFIDLGNPECDRASLSFEAVVNFHDDMSPVPGLQCHFWFDDGFESFDCAGIHEFATAGVHYVRMAVTDPTYGASLVVEREAVVYPAQTVELTAQAPACGLELSWSSVISNQSETHTTISPEHLVVGGGLGFGGAGTAQVTAPGTYTITVLAEDERQAGPVCQATATKTVEVVACPGHNHTPDCDH